MNKHAPGCPAYRHVLGTQTIPCTCGADRQQERPFEPMLQFFRYEHLPEHLQEISRPYCALAHLVAEDYPRNPERTVTLRKLLEAKDAAVRTHLYKQEA